MGAWEEKERGLGFSQWVVPTLYSWQCVES